MLAPTKPEGDFTELGETFLGMLMSDVIASLDRVATEDSQGARRDLIRTQFAAIEGAVWTYREQIRSIAVSMEALPPLTELAFAETSCAVTETGKIIQQQRYVSLTAMIRLTTNLAQTLAPDLEVDFGGSGWSDLKQTIKTRNRVTHPKSKGDLEITPVDVTTSWAALVWLMELTTDVMETAVKNQSLQSKFLRRFLDDLKKGHPAALNLYNAVLRSEDG